MDAAPLGPFGGGKRRPSSPAKPGLIIPRGTLENLHNRLMPDSLIRRLAHQTGFVRRVRNFDPVVFFRALILDFSPGVARTLSDLHRRYESAASSICMPPSTRDSARRWRAPSLRAPPEAAHPGTQSGRGGPDPRPAFCPGLRGSFPGLPEQDAAFSGVLSGRLRSPPGHLRKTSRTPRPPDRACSTERPITITGPRTARSSIRNDQG